MIWAKRLRLWRGAAAACGLSVEGTSSVWTWRLQLRARAGPVEVRIEGAQPGNVGTRIVIVAPWPPGFSEVRIRPDKLFKLREPDALGISTGDSAFDQAFIVEGPLRLIGGLLDAEARRLLLDLNNKSLVVIAHGELRAEIFDHQLSSVLPLLLALGRRFAQKTDIVNCLVENLRRDPKAGVRLNNLLLLVHECAWGPKTEEALRIACSDRSSQVRLRAAIEMGPEGRGALLKLAESMKTDDCAAQAIRMLGRALTFERTTAILDQALTKNRLQTARACLEALGHSGTAEAVDALVEVVEEDGKLADAAALALGMTGSPAAEPPLIEILHSKGKRMILHQAAAKALGRVGSVVAVLPLKEASERFPRDPYFVQVARQSIAEIQSRLPGATPGELSLAGAETGQLSLAQAETGQLSLASDPTGQLSLTAEEPGQLSLSGDEESPQPAPEHTR